MFGLRAALGLTGGQTGVGLRGEPPQLLSRANPLLCWLRDGTPVRLRLIDNRDRERLRDGFHRLSSESRYRRFFTSVPELTEAMLDRLIETDDTNHVAVGAERGGFALGTRDGLGVARFFRLKDTPDTAEVAVAVIDDMQGRGLGGLLLRALCRAARDRGIRRFRALVLPDNQAMQGLLHAIDPAAERRFEDGLHVFELIVPDVDLEQVGRNSSLGLLTLAVELVGISLARLNLFRAREVEDRPDQPAE